MKEQRAQTLILVALMLTVLLGFVALSLDGGNAYLQRRRMQNAADAGALAAARARCMGTPADYLAYGKALCESQDNGGASCALAATADGARAVASITVGTWFARVLGINTLTVSAAATGACKPIVGTGNLLPMTIALPTEGGFTIGQTYNIWDKDASKSVGSFGWLQWPNLDAGCPAHGNGAERLRTCIENPWCAPMIHVGDWIGTEPGVVNNAIWDVWDTWQCSPVTVPIYDVTNGGNGNNKAYHIIGLGEFVVTGICDNNRARACSGSPPACDASDKIIRGSFIRWVTPPDSEPGSTGYGVYRVYLTD